MFRKIYKATILSFCVLFFATPANSETMLGAYIENDPVSPLGVYGTSKLAGELAVLEQCSKSIILRTSWVFSSHGQNFVKTMLRLSETRSSLGIIVDQIGTPTYAVDLARAILIIISSNNESYGVYHYSNEGAISWFDFAKAIFEIEGSEMDLKPLRTDEYPTKAERPSFSVMDKQKIKDEFNLSIPYWRDSLKACLCSLNPTD